MPNLYHIPPHCGDKQTELIYSQPSPTVEHYEQAELFTASLFVTHQLSTTMFKLSDLLSELDKVDKLAKGQVNKLVSNIFD